MTSSEFPPTVSLAFEFEGPKKIDRYQLIAEIASGGMATVYLGLLSGVGGFQRFAAIKRLHPHLAKDGDFVEMFLDEARLAAGIHHPNVVPILEVGPGANGYYLVMEYVEGDTLAKLLSLGARSGKGLPRKIGNRIIVDMLEGLDAAHNLKDADGIPTNLVHRDVSPQNILIGMDGVSRITDFGVARAASRLTSTRAGQLKGKIAYMAPEQALGDAHKVDRRADIFSAGVVLWEVLAGRRLFKAGSEAATLAKVLTEEIPDLCEIDPTLDPQLAAVCMKSLLRDQENRFATCAEFAEAIEKAAYAVGELASVREVASYVDEVLGASIKAQRDAVRARIALGFEDDAEFLDAELLPSEAASSIPNFLGGPPPMGDTNDYFALSTTNAGGRPRMSSSAALPPPVLPPIASSPAPGKAANKIWLAIGGVVLLTGVAIWAVSQPSSEPSITAEQLNRAAQELDEAPKEVADKEPESPSEVAQVDELDSLPDEPPTPGKTAASKKVSDSQVAVSGSEQKGQSAAAAANSVEPAVSPKPTEPAPVETKPAPKKKPNLSDELLNDNPYQ